MPTPDPLTPRPSDPVSAIIADFLHAPLDLAALAHDHRLSFADLTDTLASDRAAPVFAHIRALAALRAELVGAQARVTALQKLVELVLTTDHPETARRAAAWILRATGTPPPARPRPPT
ncbi:MAG: hypothetical protein ACK4WH_15570, partial [Phycisphaerales bacterium]